MVGGTGQTPKETRNEPVRDTHLLQDGTGQGNKPARAKVGTDARSQNGPRPCDRAAASASGQASVWGTKRWRPGKIMSLQEVVIGMVCWPQWGGMGRAWYCHWNRGSGGRDWSGPEKKEQVRDTHLLQRAEDGISQGNNLKFARG